MDTIKKMTDEELDTAIAIEVMGWELVKWDVVPMDIYRNQSNEYMGTPYGWRPTTDMEQAWQVVVHTTDEGFCPALVFDDNGHWALSFEGVMTCSWTKDPSDVQTSAFVEANMWCDTAERAICESSLFSFRRFKPNPEDSPPLSP